MHEFIKKLFGGKRPAATTITLDSVPAWITERENTTRAVLCSETEEPIRIIRNAAAQLQLIVNTLAGAGHDPLLHPKLKSIAKNSLPLFVKAMNASLVKELPEDPEEFYAAAVECVKGCVNSARGQGRYLQAVFPEEMQELGTIRTLHETVTDLKTDFLKSADRDRRISERISGITKRLETIENEELALEGDERQTGIAAKREQLARIAQALDEVGRSYSAHSMTASHVFRKAEKIATRQHHPAEIVTINHAMDLLSNHDVPDADQLGEILAAACPI